MLIYACDNLVKTNTGKLHLLQPSFVDIVFIGEMLNYKLGCKQVSMYNSMFTS